jgi:hypothetical protein
MRANKTLIRPAFSATNTRPSAANWKSVGFFSPVITGVIWKLGGALAA